ncbi:hypothetical protein [Burkholderia cenocepacia]|uniref:hypothetical protein n=1 Tax=Burkholderia cenocepacia TaxID=95486 RepID=UPI00192A9255|nr:hypothetical protein [Burkholderia cenocepacia]
MTLKWLLPLLTALHVICWFLPSEVSERFEMAESFVLEKLAAIPVFLSNVWLVLAHICYFVGNFFALVLIAFGAVIVGYSVYLRRETLQFTFEATYRLAEQLAGDRVAWSGATLLIAATVAICNMWKLNLDRKQYFEKQEKELREKIEKKAKERLDKHSAGRSTLFD